MDTVYKRIPNHHLSFISFSHLNQKLYDNTNIQFLYESGKHSVDDEHGRTEPMDYIVDEKRFCLETLSPHIQQLAQLPLDNEKI